MPYSSRDDTCPLEQRPSSAPFPTVPVLLVSTCYSHKFQARCPRPVPVMCDPLPFRSLPAGATSVIRVEGHHLAQQRTRVFARLAGHDLPVTLLQDQQQQEQLALEVCVPAGAVGLMVVEVGVGHLLGGWWPVLVLPAWAQEAARELQALLPEEQRRRLPAGGEQLAMRAFRRCDRARFRAASCQPCAWYRCGLHGFVQELLCHAFA